MSERGTGKGWALGKSLASQAMDNLKAIALQTSTALKRTESGSFLQRNQVLHRAVVERGPGIMDLAVRKSRRTFWEILEQQREIPTL